LLATAEPIPPDAPVIITTIPLRPVSIACRRY
jgi:hypothetical protein